jgi:single-stranded-DNA-specific exonuclease
LEWRQKESINQYSEFDDIQTKLASIHGIDDIHRFLYPSENELHSPFLLKNLELARDRIVEALKHKQKISIYSDPDSDGISSTAIMYNYLRVLTNNVTYFSSERSEGHGISSGIDKIPEGTELLLILDSSSNEYEECAEIESNGMDVIILDHHQIDHSNPYCILVNPQQHDCSYPNKQSSGAVITWKMCQAFDEYYSMSFSETLYDLVAIGLTGDVMSLMESENRYLVHRGTNNIRNMGIKSLLSALKKDDCKITATDISYMLAPCFNAACRMDRIDVILNLLTETSIVKANQLAKQVVEMNEERKKIQKEYHDKLISCVKNDDKCSIIIDNEIGSGFRGLVSGVFCEEFQKPIMILSEDEDDTYYGSYRFYGDSDFKAFLNNIPEVIFAAGHPTVGGIKFKRSDLDVIQKYLNTHLTNTFEDDSLEYILEFDIDELNEKLIKQIETFYTISGKGFETGKFLIKNIRPQKKDILGKDKNTVKISCTSMSKSYFYDDDELLKMTPSATLMKFRTNKEFFDDSLIGKEIEVVGNLNLNVYINYQKKTTKTVQIFLDDFRVIN